MDISNRIVQLRKALGLNQEKFGERLGLTKISISAIETGKRRLTEQNRKAIIREFHVNPKWLDTGEGDMFTGLSGNKISLMQFVTDVLEAPEGDIRRVTLEVLSEIDRSDWDKVEAIVDRIASKKE